MIKKITRRHAIKLVSGAILLPVACSHLPQSTDAADNALAHGSDSVRIFAHGVASGDPDQSSVVIWTRISEASAAVNVDWQVATDASFNHIAASGNTRTDSRRDYTVKVVAADLKPGQSYYYRFVANGVHSALGQTRTLPVGHVKLLVFAVATCSNYPFGHFNAYDAIAKDPTIDLVIHLGDYIYEYGVEGFGGESGKQLGRNHHPSHETLTLEDYRQRHAQYKTDQGSLAMHARHPLVVMWDDHETANNPWMGGAKNHQADEGSWQARRTASLQAYFEWMPIRDPAGGLTQQQYWRHYKFGDLASLITLESRHTGRSHQISYNQHLPGIDSDEKALHLVDNIVGATDRNMLSPAMEDFLRAELAESVAAGRRWRMIGNQTVVAKAISPKMNYPFFEQLKPQLNAKATGMLNELTHLGKYDLPADLDTWDGYPVAREKFYQVAKDAGVNDLLVLSGDSHSYWANQLFDDKNQSMGVELGATGISSPRSLMALGEEAMQRYDHLNMAANKEIVWADGRHRGFIRLSINHDGGHADFIAVSNVETPQYETKVVHAVDIVNQQGALSFES